MRDLIGSLGTLLAGRRVAVRGPARLVRHLRAARRGGRRARRRAEARWGASPPARSRICGGSRSRRRSTQSGMPSRLSDEVFAELAHSDSRVARSANSPGGSSRPSTTPVREGLSFSSIVAAGANGASPHADPGDRVIEAGTLVTVDMGCVVDGYCSDCTRTFATGELPTQLAEAYDALPAGAARRARGRSGRRARARCRRCVAGRSRRRRGSASATATVSGTVSASTSTRRPSCARSRRTRWSRETSSPSSRAIYLPGVGGVRIEDLVLVTDDGAERLTRFGKELTVVAR